MARRLIAALIFLSAGASATTVAPVRRQMDEHKAQVQRLAAQINEMEKRLGQENKRYLQNARDKKALETRLSELEAPLEKNQTGYDKEMQEVRRLLGGMAINSLQKGQDAGSMLERKVLGQALGARARKIAALSQENAKIAGEVKNLRARLEAHARTEGELVALMAEMEEKKRERAREYMDSVKEGKAFEQRAQSMKDQFAWAEKKRAELSSAELPKGRFLPPLVGPSQFESKGKKGVTFKCMGGCEAVAAAEGTIVYVGGLSTYGNVVMIDHGDDTRTVVLGPFTPSAEKGQKVRAGDKIGSMPMAGRLYFEVRKQNVAQDTLPLVDKGALARGNDVSNLGQDKRAL